MQIVSFVNTKNVRTTPLADNQRLGVRRLDHRDLIVPDLAREATRHYTCAIDVCNTMELGETLSLT